MLEEHRDRSSVRPWLNAREQAQLHYESVKSPPKAAIMISKRFVRRLKLKERRLMEFEKFSGKLKTIQLESEQSLFDEIELGKEVRQHLIITRGGKNILTRATISSKADDDRWYDHLENKSVPLCLDLEDVETLLRAFEQTFSKLDDGIARMCDGGFWNLVLENEAGRQFVWYGSMEERTFHGADKLSDLVREKTGFKDLFVFDNCPDKIENLDFQYHRKTLIHPDTTDDEPFAIEINERLTIDRETQTLTHVHGFSPMCQAANLYRIAGGVTDLLDDLKNLNFTQRQGNPPDAIEDPDDTKKYSLKVGWRSGKLELMAGSYDKLDLPDDWPKLTDRVLDFISSYGLGDFFNEAAYSKRKRRKSDFIFCKVVFADASQEYTYLVDEDIYKEGDFAWAPAGKYNVMKIVCVTNVEYRQPDEAPFPLNRIKKLIRKLTPEEYEKYVVNAGEDLDES